MKKKKWQILHFVKFKFNNAVLQPMVKPHNHKNLRAKKKKYIYIYIYEIISIQGTNISTITI